jgi:hypothetical protein
MILGSYTFAGDPADLTVRYDALLERFRDQLTGPHISVVTDTGLTILDTCPTAEDFAGFVEGQAFRAALRDVGLPAPSIALVGDVHWTNTSSVV